MPRAPSPTRTHATHGPISLKIAYMSTSSSAWLEQFQLCLQCQNLALFQQLWANDALEDAPFLSAADFFQTCLELGDAIRLGEEERLNEHQLLVEVEFYLGQNERYNDSLWLLLVEEAAGLKIWAAAESAAAEALKMLGTEQEEESEKIIDLPLAEEEVSDFLSHFEQLLKEEDMPGLEARCCSKAFNHNLAGPGGLAVEEFCRLRALYRWSLQAWPDYATEFKEEKALLLPISCNHPQAARYNRELLLLLIYQDEWKILGIGAELREMRHLFLSFKQGLLVKR